MKKLIIALLLSTTTIYAANDIEFSSELSHGQIEEHVEIKFDNGKTCKLNPKKFLFMSTESSCSFQPTKLVHSYTIDGFLRTDEDDGKILGTGKGLILNFIGDYNKINKVKNLEELITTYNQAIESLNKGLPKDIRVKFKPMLFNYKETKSSVSAYTKSSDVSLPKDYIEMITQYGYPQNVNTFTPIQQQRSIADIYTDGYGYEENQFNMHKGIDKNKSFYQPSSDVFYVFHDETKSICDNQPMISYTIATEGDYSPYDVEYTKANIACGSFFEFFKEQVIENFVETILYTLEDYYVLPVYKNNTLKAELTYGYNDDDSLDYYFTYNDIFY